MTDTEIRIAVAEACGWKFDKHTCTNPSGKEYQAWPLCNQIALAPNYPNDLNAMHEARKILTNAQRRFYAEMLVKVHPLHYDPQSPTHVLDRMAVYLMADMDARQQAEAFLRTLGKWKE